MVRETYYVAASLNHLLGLIYGADAGKVAGVQPLRLRQRVNHEPRSDWLKLIILLVLHFRRSRRISVPAPAVVPFLERRLAPLRRGAEGVPEPKTELIVVMAA